MTPCDEVRLTINQHRDINRSSSTMASVLAHPLFRTTSLEQGIHTMPGMMAGGESDRYHGTTHDAHSSSLLPPAPMFLRDISRSSSSSTQGFGNMLFPQPNFHTRTASLSAGRAEEYRIQQQNRSALPGLTALASLATAKEQMR